LFVDANGNVGVGTSASKNSLVGGTSNGLTIGDLEAPSLVIWDTSDASYATYLAQSQADAYLYNYANGFLSIGTNNTERLRITSAGLVGIGSSSPVATNHIKGSGTSGQVTASWMLENASSGTAGMDITGAAGSSIWRFLYGGGPSTGTNTLTPALTIGLEGSAAGNVGIGVTSPGYPLDVVSDSSAWGFNIRGRSVDNIAYIRFSPNSGATTYAAIGTPSANTFRH